MSSTPLRSSAHGKKLHRRFTAPIVFFTIAGLALAGCSSSGGGTAAANKSGPRVAMRLTSRSSRSPASSRISLRATTSSRSPPRRQPM